MATGTANRARVRRPLPGHPRRGAAAQPPLAQFVFLSMLLHAFFIALFGAPSGGSREGRALWGSLNVVIRDPFLMPAPSLRLDRSPGSLLSGIAKKKGPERAAYDAPGPPRPVVRPVAPRTPLELGATRELAPRAAPEVRTITPPAVRESPPEPRIEPLPVVPLFPSPRAQERRAAPEPKPDIPPPVERVPAEAPAVPAPLVPPEKPAATELAPTPPVERAPVELQAVPVPPIERVEPPKIEPATSAPEDATPQPRSIERTESRAPEREPPAKAPPEQRAPTAFPRELPGDALIPRRESPATAPDPGTGPRIDLEAARNRARQIAREGIGQRALLPFPMPPKPEYKSKTEMALEKARKPDCKTAYQELGLLAIVPLIANEFGEGNCRW